MFFADRADAARKLAERLSHYCAARPLVLAIPRGAVPMGRIIADRLGGELDVVLVHKLGAPYDPEFAIGAVDESGAVELSSYAQHEEVTNDYLENERAAQLAEMRMRRARYGRLREPANPEGRTTIVVDDGLATGFTMGAALRSVRARHPARLVCAVPVAAADSLERIKALADEVVALYVPEVFAAVSQFYARFPQVDDNEVAALLADFPPDKGKAKDRSQE